MAQLSMCTSAAPPDREPQDHRKPDPVMVKSRNSQQEIPVIVSSSSSETASSSNPTVNNTPQHQRNAKWQTKPRQNKVGQTKVGQTSVWLRQQRLLLLHHSSKCRRIDGRCSVSLGCAEWKRVWNHVVGDRCTDTHCRVPHCFSSRSILSHYNKCRDIRCAVCGPVREVVRRSSFPQAVSPVSPNRLPPVPNFRAIDRPRRNSEWQKQRLLLLKHASKCRHGKEGCPVTPHCQKMKKLWSHTVHCKNARCKVKHCKSSRYVLRHYRRCVDAFCSTCGPARKASGETVARDVSTSSVASDGSDPTTHKERHGTSKRRQPGEEIDASGFGSPHKRPRKERSGQEEATQEGRICSPCLEGSASTQRRDARVEKANSNKVDNALDLPRLSPMKPTEEEDFPLFGIFDVENDTIDFGVGSSSLLLPESKSRCEELLKGLRTHEYGWVFSAPVDPVELGLPDYFDVIRQPMDLGTVGKKLDSDCYCSAEDFDADICLTFDNAMTYNAEGSDVHNMAKALKDKFLVERRRASL